MRLLLCFLAFLFLPQNFSLQAQETQLSSQHRNKKLDFILSRLSTLSKERKSPKEDQVLNLLLKEHNLNPENLVDLFISGKDYEVDDAFLKTLIGFFPNLRGLSLTKCGKLQDIKPLDNLKNLEKVWLGECKKIQNISPLIQLLKLKELGLRECDSIKDLSPLQKMPQLKLLKVSRDYHVPPLPHTTVEVLN